MDPTLKQILHHLFELSQAYDVLVARVAELEAKKEAQVGPSTPEV